MNDEPCMCGTQVQCLADNHLMPIDQAANVLGISEGAVLVAVHRKRLKSEGRDYRGRHVFRLEQVKTYDAARQKRRVAHA